MISLAKFGHTAPDLGPNLFFLLKILCIYLSENSDMKIEIVSNFTFITFVALCVDVVVVLGVWHERIFLTGGSSCVLIQS